MALADNKKNTNIEWLKDPRFNEIISPEPRPSEIESRIYSNLKIPIKTEHMLKKPNHHVTATFIDHEGNPYKYLTVLIPELNVQQMTNRLGEISFTVIGGKSKAAVGMLCSDHVLQQHSKHKYEFEILVGIRQKFTYRLKLSTHFYKSVPPKGTPHKNTW